MTLLIPALLAVFLMVVAARRWHRVRHGSGDTNYTFSFNHPKDDTISGSSEVFRSGEVQITHMPSQFVTFRLEGNYRHANVPYFSGEGSVTPPAGNVAPLGSTVSGWAPDLRKSESRMTAAVLVKF